MINLHGVVRKVINSLHPDEPMILYRSAGQVNISGVIKAVYDAPETVGAQIQSLSDDKLYHSGATGQNDTTRNCYLFSSNTSLEKPASIVRPFARTGDILQRNDGTWWLVTALKEDFKNAEWVNVSITQQVIAPDFTHSEWWEE